jgi:parallel beta-helix repeat protein
MKKNTLKILSCIVLVLVSVLPSVTHAAAKGPTDDESHMILSDDVLIAPDIAKMSDGGQRTGPAPGLYDTSEYMMGSVAVGVFLLESNGAIDPSTENWDTTRKNAVTTKIQQGLTWWAAQNPNTHVNFVYEWHYDIPTSYEPITRPSYTVLGDGQYLWIPEAMAAVGYTSGDIFARTRAYSNDLRTRMGTNWAFTVFVVDSNNDADGQFADSKIAYSYRGGPFVVMNYQNAGYGPANMHRVIAHEAGHIFYATDEYNGYTEWSGYLNAADNEGSSCLMDDCDLILSSGTILQVGWRDTDGDGIQDIVDTNPETTMSTISPDPTYCNQLTYTGTATVVAYPNNNPYGSHNDVTIKTISNVQFRINGGVWQSALAVDYEFNGPQEDFTFTTDVLPEGSYTIEARAVDSVGNVDPTPSSDSIVIDFPSVVYVDKTYTSSGANDGHSWDYDAFNTIQAGINRVEINGLVDVHCGTYNEHILINKPLRLVGAQRDSTIIDGDNVYQSDVVRITANGAAISGFTICDSGDWSTSPNDIDYDAGIDVSASGTTISGNKIISNYDGIFLHDSSSNNVISGNVIENNGRNGIDTTPFSYTLSNQITGNTIQNNANRGIRLTCSNSNIISYNFFSNNCLFLGQGTTTGYHADSNIIKENKFEYAGVYIDSFSGNYNQIYENTFKYTGCSLSMQSGTSQNKVYHNNFDIGATASDYSNNNWDNGYPADSTYGGNYWYYYGWNHDTFKGSDQNIPGPDGIGDLISGGKNPYEIPGTTPSQDRYPFVEYDGWHKGYGTCFVRGTKITLADSSTKNIEDVVIGDRVMAYNEVSRKLVPATVSNIFHHEGAEMSSSYLFVNSQLGVTANHLLYSNGKWIAAGELKIGDSLFGIDGKPIPVTSIEKIEKTVPTYNLEVSVYHNYFADGYLAHNKQFPLPYCAAP